jgi:diadenosine tetraphosphate (Ap4A) HIT family hydrolase
MSARSKSGPPGCGICGLIDKIRSNSFPDFIAELEYSFVILGDAQFYRGYCALLLKEHMTGLHALDRRVAHGFFDEVLRTASAIVAAVQPVRMNHECLGNQEPHLHWHLFPRHAGDSMRLEPVWLRPEAERKVTLEDSERRALISGIRSALASP